jgi:hypothetical protein
MADFKGLATNKWKFTGMLDLTLSVVVSTSNRKVRRDYRHGTESS